jgi:hypothetical protein
MFWSSSSDTDGLTYSLLVATDQSFTNANVVHRQDDLQIPFTTLPDSALKDPSNPGFYYCQNSNPPCWWKVLAIDSFGEITESTSSYSFKIVKTGGIPGFIQGFVVNAVTGEPLSIATVTAGGSTVGSQSNGAFALLLSDGPYTVTARASGFSDSVSNITLVSGASVNHVFQMTPVTQSYPLTVTYAGSGSGSINSQPDGIHCTSNNCPPASFNAGSTVKLTEAPDPQSIFDGWDTSVCSIDVSGACDIIMNSSRGLTVTFDTKPPIWLFGTTVYPATLLSAFASAADKSSILLKTGTISGDQTFEQGSKIVTLKGGYDASYGSNNGYTTINGKLAIKSGTLMVERVVVK